MFSIPLILTGAPSLPPPPPPPPPPLQVKVVKQRDKSEVFFRRMLKEDKGAGQWEGSSYIDFLCQIHRDIKDLLN